MAAASLQAPQNDGMIGYVPAATAILDRFLHHAEIITIQGRSYRLNGLPDWQTGRARKKEDKDCPPARGQGERQERERGSSHRGGGGLK